MQRQHVEDAVGVAPAPRIDEARRVRLEVGVRQHHPFRQARCATREDNEGCIVALGRCAHPRAVARATCRLPIQPEEGASLGRSDRLEALRKVVARARHQAAIGLLDGVPQLLWRVCGESNTRHLHFFASSAAVPRVPSSNSDVREVHRGTATPPACQATRPPRWNDGSLAIRPETASAPSRSSLYVVVAPEGSTSAVRPVAAWEASRARRPLLAVESDRRPNERGSIIIERAAADGRRMNADQFVESGHAERCEQTELRLSGDGVPSNQAARGILGSHVVHRQPFIPSLASILAASDSACVGNLVVSRVDLRRTLRAGANAPTWDAIDFCETYENWACALR
eukprot:5845426-Prymnesium_polylepis.1